MNKCKCGKKMTFYAKMCRNCYRKFSNISKNNPMFGKKLYGKNNGMYGKKQNILTKQKIRIKRYLYYKNLSLDEYIKMCKNNQKANKHITVKHHLYGKQFKETIKLSRNKHIQLHHNAYFYILERYGKKAILDYIKWFNRKYGGN